ncbi:hypothetical protein BYT27DRAFT_6429023 [Phlegmacium glaucopus]|nr:hypothetical protein BYT27DRAFT_6429023 [Phlegmacium glaucopus]
MTVGLSLFAHMQVFRPVHTHSTLVNLNLSAILRLCTLALISQSNSTMTILNRHLNHTRYIDLQEYYPSQAHYIWNPTVVGNILTGQRTHNIW